MSARPTDAALFAEIATVARAILAEPIESLDGEPPPDPMDVEGMFHAAAESAAGAARAITAHERRDEAMRAAAYLLMALRETV